MQPLKKFLEASFRFKVLVPVVLVMAVILAGAMFVVNLQFRQYVEENALNEFKLANVRLKDNLVRFQNSQRGRFQTLARVPMYRAAFESKNTETIRVSLTQMYHEEQLASERIEFMFYTPVKSATTAVGSASHALPKGGRAALVIASTMDLSVCHWLRQCRYPTAAEATARAEPVAHTKAHKIACVKAARPLPARAALKSASMMKTRSTSIDPFDRNPLIGTGEVSSGPGTPAATSPRGRSGCCSHCNRSSTATTGSSRGVENRHSPICRRLARRASLGHRT